MSEWKAKRFWTAANVVAMAHGFTVELDGRAVKTPAKAPLVVPTQDMAQAIAVEWDAQGDKIDPMTMPVTRGANAAIDKVSIQKAEVVEMLAAYGDSDLLCYRAAAPDELVALQRTTWDPLLDWAAKDLGAPLVCAEGVMHVPQDAAVLHNLKERVAQQTSFQLAGFHDLVAMSGSLILAFAVTEGRLPAPEAWDISRVDEDYQISQWGADEDAAADAAIKKTAFINAARFFAMSMT